MAPLVLHALLSSLKQSERNKTFRSRIFSKLRVIYRLHGWDGVKNAPSVAPWAPLAAGALLPVRDPVQPLQSPMLNAGPAAQPCYVVRMPNYRSVHVTVSSLVVRKGVGVVAQ